jgi:hypothetical protein
MAVGRDIAEFFQDCDTIVGNFEAMITDQPKRGLTQQRHNEEIIADLADAFLPGRTFLTVANHHAGMVPLFAKH